MLEKDNFLKNQKPLMWTGVSKAFLCPVCKKHDWCTVASLGNDEILVCCRRSKIKGLKVKMDINNVKYQLIHMIKLEDTYEEI